MSAAPFSRRLTTVAGWLKAVLSEGAPAYREDVSGVVLAPVVKGSPPTVKHDEDLIALHFSNCGGADEVRVLLVHRLQLHAWLKAILRGSWWFLEIKATSSFVIAAAFKYFILF